MTSNTTTVREDESNTVSNKSITESVVQPINVNIQKNVELLNANVDNTPKVEDTVDLQNIKTLVENCKKAVDDAHGNAKQGFEYKTRITTFIKNNAVYRTENGTKTLDDEKTKEAIGKRIGVFDFLGNHYAKNMEDHLGQWTGNSYTYEGKYFPQPAKYPKDIGVETLSTDQHFYGKFDEKTGNRLSGAYVWGTDNPIKYLGSFDGTGIAGFGCMERMNNSKKEYIVAEFKTNKQNKVEISGNNYVLFTKDGDEPSRVRYCSINPNEEQKIFKDEDRKQILSIFSISKMDSEFQDLNKYEKVYKFVEENLGIGRTALGVVGAAVAVAGLGYLAYRKFFKKSSPAKKTQKKKSVAKRLGRYINPYSWSFDDSSSSSSSSSSKKKKATPAAASSESNAASVSASAAPAPASAHVAKKIEEKDSKESSSAAAAAKPKPKRVYQRRSKVASPASASPQTTVEDSKAPAKPTVNKRSQKKVTPTPTPTRRSARLNGR